MKKKVSVIIPTINSRRTLKNCLKSLEKQTLSPFEIIVIDNGSLDGSPEMVRRQFPKVRLIAFKKNTGVAGGRNIGMKNAGKNTDYYFFFDHDMIARPSMLEELVRVGEMDEKIGITTPKIFYLADKSVIWAAGTGVNLWTGQVLFRGGKDVGQYDKLEEVQVAPAAILVKRKVVEKIGYFDDKIFAVWEDTDFCFRAKKTGYLTYFTPKAIAYHDLSMDPKDEAKRLLTRGLWVGRNRVIFMKRYGRSFLLFLLFIPVYMIYYLKLSLAYHNLKGFLEFMKGTWEGLFASS